MAPRMNEVLEKARQPGRAHHSCAQQSCMKAYDGNASQASARSLHLHSRSICPTKLASGANKFPSEELSSLSAWIKPMVAKTMTLQNMLQWAEGTRRQRSQPQSPLDASDRRLAHRPRTKDAISDSGIEIWNLLESSRIDNVILMGVHLNMCVSRSPLRAAVRLAKERQACRAHA
jgi:nicotinamidase-related amidase